MNSRRFFTLVLASLILSSATVSAKRILFYEVGTPEQYQIEKGYSKFKQELQARGYDVASITQPGSLTKEKLEGYDVLVIQDLRRQFEIEDISAILWFVMQKGSGLFINGGDPNAANKLTIPFGTAMDAATLKDITSPIAGDTNNFDFMITQFPPEDEYRVLRQGVNKFGFYKGGGLLLSGDARCMATGDADTFSDTGSFAAGSKPCVASAALFGNGLVFVLSDPDLLTDKNIDGFDNKLMGLNIIDWVSMTRELPTSGNTSQDIAMIISSLNLENKRLSAQVEQLTKEKSFLEGSVSELSNEVADLNDKITQMEGERVGPLTKTNWVLLVLGLCVLGGAFLLSKRREKETVEAADIGYELGEELGDLTEVGGGEQKPK
jgi:hypothetical protein